MTSRKLHHLLADLDIRALPAVRQARVETGHFGEAIPGRFSHASSLAQWRTQLENVATDLVKGVLLEIIYTDAADEVTSRRIHIHRLQRNDGKLYLSAYCLEREALRHFRIDRIDEVIVLGTGEVFSSGADWLQSLEIAAPPMPLAKTHHAPALIGDSLRLWHLVRDPAIVLMFAARCDGKVHNEEQAVVAEFALSILDAVAPEATDSDIRAASHMALCLCPDGDMMVDAVAAILELGNTDALAALWHGVDRLITADGKRTPQEHAFKARLKELIAPEGNGFPPARE